MFGFFLIITRFDCNRNTETTQRKKGGPQRQSVPNSRIGSVIQGYIRHIIKSVFSRCRLHGRKEGWNAVFHPNEDCLGHHSRSVSGPCHYVVLAHSAGVTECQPLNHEHSLYLPLRNTPEDTFRNTGKRPTQGRGVEYKTQSEIRTFCGPRTRTHVLTYEASYKFEFIILSFSEFCTKNFFCAELCFRKKTRFSV